MNTDQLKNAEIRLKERFPGWEMFIEEQCKAAVAGTQSYTIKDFGFHSFISSMTAVAIAIHVTNVAHGFWPENPDDRNDGEAIALMHSELSEGLEALRKKLMDDKLTWRPGIECELADCFIRIADYALGKKLDLAGAIVEKMAFNASRPYKHGKEF